MTNSFADFDKETPGGIFTKHLYEPGLESNMKESLLNEEEAAKIFLLNESSHNLLTEADARPLPLDEAS